MDFKVKILLFLFLVIHIMFLYLPNNTSLTFSQTDVCFTCLTELIESALFGDGGTVLTYGPPNLGNSKLGIDYTVQHFH